MASVESNEQFNPFDNDYECNICYEYCYDNKQDCRVCCAALCNDCYQKMNEIASLRNKCPSCRGQFVPEPEPEPEPEHVIINEDETNFHQTLIRDFGQDTFDAEFNRYYFDGIFSASMIRMISGRRLPDNLYYTFEPDNIFENGRTDAFDEFEVNNTYLLFREVQLGANTLLVPHGLVDVTKRNAKSLKLRTSDRNQDIIPEIHDNRAYKFNTSGGSNSIPVLLRGTAGETIKIPQHDLWLISQYSHISRFTQAIQNGNFEASYTNFSDILH